MNGAFLGIKSWSPQGTEFLIADICKARYHPQSNSLNTSYRKSCSWGFKIISNGVDSIKNNIISKFGDGKQVIFRFAKWESNETLFNKISSYLLDDPLSWKVVDVIYINCWNFAILHSVQPHHIIVEIMTIPLKLVSNIFDELILPSFISSNVSVKSL